MQTFLPYPHLQKSLQSLDKSRLQKQAIETSQIIDAILGLPTKKGTPRKGWLNHPALLMWKDNVGFLFEYFLLNIEECQKRNIKTDYCQSRISGYEADCVNRDVPIWFGDSLIHNSHQARILQKPYEQLLKQHKDAEDLIQWYKDQEFDIMNRWDLFDMEYQWPSLNDEGYCLREKVSPDRLKIKNTLIATYGLNPYKEAF